MSEFELTRLVADRHKLDSGELRPCVARMLENGKTRILDIKPEHICFMVAVDFKRMDLTEERSKEILHAAGLTTLANVRDAVLSAKNEKYKVWKCESATMKYELDQIRQYFCIDKDSCLWFQTHEGKTNRRFDRAADGKFEKFGWHHIVSASEYILIQKLREQEHIHGVGTGGLVIASHDKLAYLIGCTRRHVGTVIKGLEGCGLIRYEVGDATRKENRASRIQRVFPVPAPPAKFERKLKEFEEFKRFGRID